MDISKQKINQIVELAKNHKLIAIGEMHGVKQNPEIILEVVSGLKEAGVDFIIGLEYPQSVIDSPENVEDIYFKDGRFSAYHETMLETLKKEGFELFGYDIFGEQLKQQESKVIDWRDKKMAENINKELSEISPGKKILIVCGDIHYQTKEQDFMYPDKEGNIKPTAFLPMAARINVPSLLAIHIRYLSGSLYNFKLKTMPKIDVNKEISFRDVDDVVEIDVAVAEPTQE